MPGGFTVLFDSAADAPKGYIWSSPAALQWHNLDLILSAMPNPVLLFGYFLDTCRETTSIFSLSGVKSHFLFQAFQQLL